MKIIDKIQQYRAAGRPFYSFEFFPPKTDSGVNNLYSRLDRMAAMEPAFIDVTWGAGGTSTEKSLAISQTAQQYFGLDVMMHLTCTNMRREELYNILKRADAAGLRNILALRGDPPLGKHEWEQVEGGFRYASDLTRFIREEFGDRFGICVGAYPEGHLEASSRADDIQYLKQKVDAGADFIITQLFYDMDEYFGFLDRVRDAGITCPIIPGILPIHNYQRFLRFTDVCQIKVPDSVREALEPIKNDDAAVLAYGIELCAEMCKKLLDNGSPGLHFYTLNLESSAKGVLEKLGLSEDCRTRRAFPWRPSTDIERRGEDVRPIFWSNRPKSYLTRTQQWDDFPNGRWGDSRSPTFGALNDYYMLRRGIGLAANESELRQAYGTPETLADVGKVFANFCKGEINRLPWCELPVQAETTRITQPLVDINEKGFWSINSQPQVNATASDDPDVGWGGRGGYIFQKAYIEFFVSPALWAQLQQRLKNFPSITYHAVNLAGERDYSSGGNGVNAVTWGVFPGKEIVQPTVVDTESFLIWREEAFDLWLTDWRSLYPEGTPSYELLTEIHQSFYLVNLVENDFVGGNVFAVFEGLT